ncbi:hypothetical protein CC85DRAFT_326197 [Cutaneotrichosporon oleaginosum]|uniref:SnoaL-like domain-containing protein n=1 Tax=Cutaneotrichosporon oleaginosum TaxID=879819 RepID=A0A0J0XV50_9TREE|nr:uncharacterized protein CC85DRAFT_326197 [Cutaneotrichosporon oleaginosum]KLT44930.1 hypothetical protein CC85DRAFT_326197 [Cutaneotrichosporon oleaginosum]TXT12058.1 hypothetical protein COLE_02468 [Cutaneotrichosporon oleaginosum]
MSLSPERKALVEEFYASSDRADDSWLDMFTPDCVIDFSGVTARGTEQLRHMREVGAKVVQNRVHYLDDVWVCGRLPDTVLATGRIDQDRLADGAKIRGLEWVGRIEFAGEKISKYTIFVSFPPLEAKAISEIQFVPQ